jgi:hypothetical protein
MALIETEDSKQKAKRAPRKKEGDADRLILRGKEISESSGFTRTTLLIREKHLKALKALAYWERVSMTYILEQILDGFLSGKDIPPIPKEKKKILN